MLEHCRLQAAQTFLPASIGYPAAAWRFAKRMMLAGCIVGVMNSVASGQCMHRTPCSFTFARVFLAADSVHPLQRQIAPLISLEPHLCVLGVVWLHC